jgi:FAD:protein FMN transferase
MSLHRPTKTAGKKAVIPSAARDLGGGRCTPRSVGRSILLLAVALLLAGAVGAAGEGADRPDRVSSVEANLASRWPEHVATVERRLALMGTSLDLEVAGPDRAAALAASERAVAALEAAEARLSTWRDQTELARLNRAPAGAPFALSPALAADLAAARRCWEETGGAFDPTVGPLVAAWGLRTGGREPSATELAQALAATGMPGLRLAGATAERTGSGVVIEEGGFGKGAGLRDALAALAAAGVPAARLDLGGQVALLGSRPERLAVADPRRRDRPVVEVEIQGGSLSTSGNSERGIVVAGRRIGHLLDPRTGKPAPDFGSMTVWAADPLRADCLSTGLFVLGPEAALAWAAAHPEVAVLALAPRQGKLQALASANLKGRLKALAPEVEIHYGGNPETLLSALRDPLLDSFILRGRRQPVGNSQEGRTKAAPREGEGVPFPLEEGGREIAQIPF